MHGANAVRRRGGRWAGGGPPGGTAHRRRFHTILIWRRRATTRRTSRSRAVAAAAAGEHTVAFRPKGSHSTHGLTRATSGPVVVDGESFLDALFASAGQG